MKKVHMTAMPADPPGEPRRPGSLYRLLEKSRAGFGAAGLAASLTEAIASTHYLAAVVGVDRVISNIIVALIALAAFVWAARVVDVPEALQRQR